MHLNVKHYTLNNTIYIMRMKDNVAAPPQDAPTFMVLSNNRRHRTNLGAFVFGVPVAFGVCLHLVARPGCIAACGY